VKTEKNTVTIAFRFRQVLLYYTNATPTDDDDDTDGDDDGGDSIIATIIIAVPKHYTCVFSTAHQNLAALLLLMQKTFPNH
jgi:hypothetical protein